MKCVYIYIGCLSVYSFYCFIFSLPQLQDRLSRQNVQNPLYEERDKRLQFDDRPPRQQSASSRRQPPPPFGQSIGGLKRSTLGTFVCLGFIILCCSITSMIVSLILLNRGRRSPSSLSSPPLSSLPWHQYQLRSPLPWECNFSCFEMMLSLSQEYKD